jgi:hypothetical protein
VGGDGYAMVFGGPFPYLAFANIGAQSKQSRLLPKVVVLVENQLISENFGPVEFGGKRYGIVKIFKIRVALKKA